MKVPCDLECLCCYHLCVRGIKGGAGVRCFFLVSPSPVPINPVLTEKE